MVGREEYYREADLKRFTRIGVLVAMAFTAGAMLFWYNAHRRADNEMQDVTDASRRGRSPTDASVQRQIDNHLRRQGSQP